MIETLLNKYGPDQLSYYVEDLDEAAERFHKLFGAGPFIKMGPFAFRSACIAVRKSLLNSKLPWACGAKLKLSWFIR